MNKHLFTVMILFAVFSTHAQQSAATAGGDASGKSGTTAYSVGQTSYTEDVGNGSSAQGVQHAYEIYEVSKAINGAHFTMYPNPTADLVNIAVENAEKGNLSYQLYNTAGKLLSAGKLDGETTSVAMKGYASGIYLIRLYSDEQPIQTFKIIKNQ